MPTLGLRARFVVLVALAVALACLAAGAIALGRTRDAIQADILRAQQAVADLTSVAIRGHLGMIESAQREVANRPSIAMSLATDPLRATPELEVWLDNQEERVTAIDLLDRSGMIRATGVDDKSRLTQAIDLDRELIRQVLQSGRETLGLARPAMNGRTAVVPHVIPVRDAAGNVIGAVRVSISLAGLSRELIAVQPAPDTRIAIVDGELRIILAHVDESRILQRLSGRNPAVERLLAGERGADENTSSVGEAALAAFTPVQGTRWGVLVQQPLATAWQPVYAAQRDLAIVVVLATLVAAALGAVLAYWVLGSLARLRSAADAMARGELYRRADLKRRDEIGELGRAFDHMADQLQARDARLADALARLQAVVDAVDDGILVADEGHVIRGANPAACRLFRRPSVELVGQRLDDLVDGRPWLRGADVVEAEGTVTIDGVQIPVRLLAREVRFAGGVQVVVVLQDLRARQVAERAAALEQLNALQREFISVASHELRSPATTVLGLSEVLAEQITPDDPRSEIAELVAQESLRLARLIEDVLDTSRLDSGRVEVSLDQVDLSNVVEGLLDSLRTRAPDHTISSTIDPSARWVTADRGKVGQIVGNLLDNAVKYSPSGGRIVVEARPSSSSWVEVVVADEGMGIPDDQLDRVFDWFYRVDSSDRRAIRGTGLGLYIVRQLVELHGGTIHAERRSERGTIFRFTLPTAAAPAAQKTGTRLPLSGPASPPTV